MAFDSNGIKFLLHAKKMGVDFRTTATIGRQYNYAAAADIHNLFIAAGQPPVAIESIQDLLDKQQGFSEGIFRVLGADTSESFDASDFEGATNVHDFNFPIDERFKNSYSAVFDGGTLEHVFNYPIALRNCMEMITEGGHFLAITPANNFPGHGFYQFSPELFFRVFSANNGFEVVDVIFMEDYPEAPWYRVADPERIGRRVTFENTRPAYLFVLARRMSVKPIFERFPQQSDYSSAWENGETSSLFRAKKKGLASRIPRAAMTRIRRLVDPRAIRFAPSDLSPFDPFDASTSSRRIP